ncbi:MAG TPA: flavin reductase [Bacteroidales bacterium]|nr:flavin reductase [Bacteroidales bacterium]
MAKTISLLIVSLIFFNTGNSQTSIKDNPDFEIITYKDLDYNAVEMIGSEWMLITAGNMESFNMMTASWGTLGWLWQMPVSTIYVRPQRFTHQFTEREDYYTLTFFEEKYKDTLRLMGTVSGKDYDKMHNSGLTPVKTENSVAFSEAYLIIECRKVYSTILKEDDFKDKEVCDGVYPKKDFHTVYVGEIVNIWRKKKL